MFILSFSATFPGGQGFNRWMIPALLATSSRYLPAATGCMVQPPAPAAASPAGPAARSKRSRSFRSCERFRFPTIATCSTCNS